MPRAKKSAKIEPELVPQPIVIPTRRRVVAFTPETVAAALPVELPPKNSGKIEPQNSENILVGYGDLRQVGTYPTYDGTEPQVSEPVRCRTVKATVISEPADPEPETFDGLVKLEMRSLGTLSGIKRMIIDPNDLEDFKIDFRILVLKYNKVHSVPEMTFNFETFEKIVIKLIRANKYSSKKALYDAVNEVYPLERNKFYQSAGKLNIFPVLENGKKVLHLYPRPLQ